MSIICIIDWNALSAIANMMMVLAAFCSICFSIYHLKKNNKQRIEDMRARIDFSIVNHMYGYYLCIENVGKETAYDINIKVQGAPIDNNLYYYVKQLYYELNKKTFILKGGEKRYFFISPSNLDKDILLPLKEKKTKEEINDWLKEYGEKPIIVTGQYNNRYSINNNFTIRNYNILEAFPIPDPLETIARVISDMDTYTFCDIKNYLQNIADNLDTNNTWKN